MHVTELLYHKHLCTVTFQILRTASIILPRSFIALMIEAVRTSETSVYKRLHGAISQKALIFILSAVRT
jgi:hypothetical protein